MSRLINKYILRVTLVLSFYGAYGSTTNQKGFHYKLQETKNNDTVLYRSFFDCFPNNFQEFVNKYGDINSSFYIKYVIHLKTFEESFKYVDDNKWVEKLITLSRGAKWDADAVHLFQNIFKYKFAMKTELFLEALIKKNKVIQYDFFYFYLDTLHPTYTELPKELIGLNPELRKIAIEAMNDVNDKYK